MSETKCEVCWRGYTEDEGHLTGERGPAACYRLGYERLRDALKRFTDHVEQQIREVDVPSIAELRGAQAALAGNAAVAAPEVPEIERLKAENASLREERDKARTQIDRDTETIARLKIGKDAIKQRNIALEGALRSAIGLSERLVLEHGASAKENQAPRCGCAMCETARDLIILGKQLLKYRAALHDEERRQQQQENALEAPSARTATHPHTEEKA